MLEQLAEFLTSPMRGYVVNYFEANAQSMLKPHTNVQPPDAPFLSFPSTPTYQIRTLSVKSGDRTLYSHQLQFNSQLDKKSSTKKAIVYMPGNWPFISDSLPDAQALLENILKIIPTTDDITTVCQHYRGRGTNRLNFEENFSQYTVWQDVQDQALLILELVKMGYKPNNIMIIGYSYGSLIAIWTAYHLIEMHDHVFKELKIISDRGFGDLFACTPMRLLVYDQLIPIRKMNAKGVLPNLPLKKITQEYLPNSFIIGIDKDASIPSILSFHGYFDFNEMQGRNFLLCASSQNNSHFASRKDIQSKAISSIFYHHFLAAILAECRLKVIFNKNFDFFDKQFIGYPLLTNAKSTSNDFVKFSLPIEENSLVQEPAHQNITVHSNAIYDLVKRLHSFCIAEAKAAAANNGAGYKMSWSPNDWTAKQKISTAVGLMNILLSPLGSGLLAMRTYAEIEGPHHTLESLKKIVEEMLSLMEEYQQILAFNKWIALMPIQRQQRDLMTQQTEKNSELDWIEMEDSEDSEWHQVPHDVGLDEFKRLFKG